MAGVGLPLGACCERDGEQRAAIGVGPGCRGGYRSGAVVWLYPCVGDGVVAVHALPEQCDVGLPYGNGTSDFVGAGQGSKLVPVGVDGIESIGAGQRVAQVVRAAEQEDARPLAVALGDQRGLPTQRTREVGERLPLAALGRCGQVERPERRRCCDVDTVAGDGSGRSSVGRRQRRDVVGQSRLPCFGLQADVKDAVAWLSGRLPAEAQNAIGGWDDGCTAGVVRQAAGGLPCVVDQHPISIGLRFGSLPEQQQYPLAFGQSDGIGDNAFWQRGDLFPCEPGGRLRCVWCIGPAFVAYQGQ